MDMNKMLFLIFSDDYMNANVKIMSNQICFQDSSDEDYSSSCSDDSES